MTHNQLPVVPSEIRLNRMHNETLPEEEWDVVWVRDNRSDSARIVFTANGARNLRDRLVEMLGPPSDCRECPFETD